MRTLLLAVLVVGTGLAATGCGGCYSRSKESVVIDKPRACLDLEVVSEARTCGGGGGSGEREVTLQGYNLCNVPLTWPGMDPVPSSAADFQLKLPLKAGAHTVTFKLGAEELLATFTIAE